MKQSRILLVGLDVHKVSINVVIAEGHLSGEVRHYGRVRATWPRIDPMISTDIWLAKADRYICRNGGTARLAMRLCTDADYAELRRMEDTLLG